MTLHKDATSIHKGAYVSTTDPAGDATLGVAAGKLWIDTSTGPPFQMKVRNAANTGWDLVGGVGSSAPDFPTMVAAFTPEFYYRLNESTGAPIDTTPNATPATLNGSGATQGVTGLLAGSSNKALSIAGAAYVNVPTLARLRPATLTLFCLFKPTTSGARNPLITFDATDYWSQGRGLSLEMDGTGKIHVNVSQGGAAFSHAIGKTVLQGGTTYFIAATFDGATVNVFLNGILEGSLNFPYAVSWTNPTAWRIGSNAQTGSGTEIFASGVIDEAGLIASALTEAQIETLAMLALGEAAPARTYLDREFITGFEPEYIDGSTIRVKAGACYIPATREIKSIQSATAVGATFSASTWYYVYAYWSAGKLLFEFSTTAPTFYGENAAIKGTDFTRRFTGVCFLTNASAQITYFHADGFGPAHEINYKWKVINTAAPFRVVNLGNPGNGVGSGDISLSGVVPDIVYKKFAFQVTLNFGAGDVVNFGCGHEIISSAYYSMEYVARHDARNGASSGGGEIPGVGEIRLIARSFQYIISYVSSGSVTVDAHGYTVRR
jgi:hypothetical protein